MEQQVNLNINDGVDFFAHETSVHYTPMQFIFDFKSVTPRIDPRSKQKPTFVMRHNVVIVDPHHAKQMIQVLQTAVENYEKKFGKISQPKQLKKLEKERKSKTKTKKSTSKASIPTYLG